MKKTTEKTESLFTLMSKKIWHWDSFVDESKAEKDAFELINYHVDDAAIEIINGAKPELLDYVYLIIKDNKNRYNYYSGAVDGMTVDEILDILETAVVASVHSQN